MQAQYQDVSILVSRWISERFQKRGTFALALFVLPLLFAMCVGGP